MRIIYVMLICVAACYQFFLLFVQLMMILIKVSDISNEARPMEVAEPWLDCLLQEFYNQVTESFYYSKSCYPLDFSPG